MPYRKCAQALVLLAGSALPALCAETFSGTTAAYVDWSVRACEFKSSDKTRALVEQTKAAGESRFSDRYVKAYASKELTEANATPAATSKLCERVLEWYGASGSRIPGLVTKAAETAAPTSTAKSTKGEGRSGRRRRTP